MTFFRICTIVFFTVPALLSAQFSYGGSACVSVINRDGVTRVLNVTCNCYSDDPADAKARLLRSLESNRRYDEDFSGPVLYSIDSCDGNDRQRYGGSGSVMVEDQNGRTRVLNVALSCTSETAPDVRNRIFRNLESNKRYNEEYVSEVYYEIDLCQRKVDLRYGGSGSVMVIDDNGNTRALNAIQNCNFDTASDVRQRILRSLESDKRYNEVFAGVVNFEIDKCEF